MFSQRLRKSPRSLSKCLVLLAAVMMMVQTAPSFSQKASADSPTTTTFPLMAWDYATDEKTVQAMSECGVNMIAFVPPEMLDACERHNVKAIVFDEAVSGRDWTKLFDGAAAVRALETLIPTVNKHPAVIGYHLKDEPPPADYPELAKAVAKVKELAPGKWPYINLLPGDGEAYAKYVRDFVTICKPTALSYDRYVLGEDGKFHEGFWTNIALFRTVALEHGLPFWNIILTAPHWSYRELTQADLRLQIFGSLVYGVSGISFYKFCSESLPILDAPDLGNFRMGPIDQFGEKTPVYDWLKNINRQVHNLAPVLMKLKSTDVYHFGDAPELNHGPTSSTLVKSMDTPDFVAGDFVHEDGSRYVMLVNKSLEHSRVVTPKFNKEPQSIEFVSPFTGRHQKFPVPYYWLAPGQGVLLKIR